MSKEPRKPGSGSPRAARSAPKKTAASSAARSAPAKAPKPAAKARKPAPGAAPRTKASGKGKASKAPHASAESAQSTTNVETNVETDADSSSEHAEPIEPEVLPLEADEDGALAKDPLAAIVTDDEPEEAIGGVDAADASGASSDSPDSELAAVKPRATDLTRADALTRYLSEISRHPLLTREEEHDLASRFKETADPQLAYRLVTANLRLVVKIAMEFRRAAFNVLDLIQEGNVGLMQAVQKYDPHRGVKLSSYAAWWIRAYILRYLMDNWRMVKLGTTQAQRKLFFNLRKEQEKLLSQGFEAAPKLLAEKLDVSEQDIREMDQRLGNDELSIDAPVSSGDESKQTYGDRLSESARGADDQLGDEELRRVFRDNLMKFGETLTSDKDKFLFEHRIAVPDGQEPLTLQQVGEKYGFTRERARQIEARLTDRLREYMRERMPDFAQLSFNEPEDKDEDGS